MSVQDFKIPSSDVIDDQMIAVKNDRDAKVKQIKQLYAIELRRLRSLYRLAKLHEKDPSQFNVINTSASRDDATDDETDSEGGG